jgi:CheY-like chemotaxis protein
MPRILVIEDDSALRKVYVNVLVKEGFTVDSAVDGAEGLSKAEASEPDLILLDMRMPHMTGIEFLRAYDLRGRHPKVRVVAFSASDVPQLVDEATQLGVSRYLAKYSFTPRSMIAVIKEALAQDPRPGA